MFSSGGRNLTCGENEALTKQGSQIKNLISLPGREVWRSVPGFERHEVSCLGRVKSLNYKNSGEERVLYTKKRRYEQILLKKDGKRSFFEVHRLVADAFPEICGERFEGAEVHHIDGNKLNNVAINLKWVDMHTHRARHNHKRTKKHA